MRRRVILVHIIPIFVPDWAGVTMMDEADGWQRSVEIDIQYIGVRARLFMSWEKTTMIIFFCLLYVYSTKAASIGSLPVFLGGVFR